MDVTAKVAELGLTIPTAALPVAAYIPTVKTGNLVFTAGQLPLLDGLNAIAAAALVCDINKIERVVQVRGFVNGVPGFVGHPGVINGVSELFIHIWGEEKGKHARTAVGIAELPLNAPPVQPNMFKCSFCKISNGCTDSGGHHIVGRLIFLQHHPH